jgi:hypothetical protein
VWESVGAREINSLVITVGWAAVRARRVSRRFSETRHCPPASFHALIILRYYLDIIQKQLQLAVELNSNIARVLPLVVDDCHFQPKPPCLRLKLDQLFEWSKVDGR